VSSHGPGEPSAARPDARAVLPWLAVLIGLAFTLSHPMYLGALAVATWTVVALTSPWRDARPYLSFGLMSGLGVFLINPIVSRMGTTVVFAGPVLPILGRFTVTAEAVAFGFGMALRLLTVSGGFAFLSAAVDPDAALRVLSPLSSGSALILALTVRLFPTMARDAARIADAQRARGRRFDTGTLAARVAARLPVVDSLLMTSLERSMQIAESMESRGYGRPGRTNLRPSALAGRERLALVLSAAALVSGIALAIGPASFAYYPVLPDLARRADLVFSIGLGVLAAAAPLSAWRWTRSHW